MPRTHRCPVAPARRVVGFLLYLTAQIAHAAPRQIFTSGPILTVDSDDRGFEEAVLADLDVLASYKEGPRVYRAEAP